MSTEILPAGIGYVNDEGDILPLDDLAGLAEDTEPAPGSSTIGITPEGGPFPSVKFSEAAVALEVLMDYCERHGRARGARPQLPQPRRAAEEAKDALSTLVDAPTLRLLGHSESEIARLRAELLEDMRDRYGRPGRSRQRKKLVDGVQKLASLQE